MSQHNSSTSSSNASDPGSTSDPVREPASGNGQVLGDLLRVGIWAIVGLIGIDLGIQVGLLVLQRPADQKPNALYQYFTYGRSIEAKLERITDPNTRTPSGILEAGWPEVIPVELPSQADPGDDFLVAVYGMSFSGRITKAMAEQDGAMTLRVLGGPGAPANHSLATYEADRGNHEADVVILGILASSVVAMNTITGLTWAFEAPAPYCYPRYRVRNAPKGETSVERVSVNIMTPDQFASRFWELESWAKFREQLAQDDGFYMPLLFRRGPLDSSSIACLIRRSVWHRTYHAQVDRIHTSEGFREQTDQIRSLRWIVDRFVEQARQDGQLPVLLLIENKGFDDHLDQLLGEQIDRLGCLAVSTHEVVNQTVGPRFLGDGHFVPQIDQEVGAILGQAIREQFQQQGK